MIDTGVGIEASMLPRVFDLFVQDAATLDRARGGLGLGLTIVRSIVQLHAGTVEAYSAGKGKGSEFSLRLPLSASALAGDVDRASSELRRRPTAGVQRVLVVDDNQDAAALLSELLEDMGHTVCTAFDAPAALALLDEFTPSVALLDIGLPGMDGYELLSAFGKAWADGSCAGGRDGLRTESRSRAVARVRFRFTPGETGRIRRRPARGRELIGPTDLDQRLSDAARAAASPELVGVDRLGQVVGRPGIEAFLPVAFHGFGGERDDRQAPE